jgi:hypothetical protein
MERDEGRFMGLVPCAEVVRFWGGRKGNDFAYLFIHENEIEDDGMRERERERVCERDKERNRRSFLFKEVPET